MINIKSFLEASTIHGLIYISTNQKLIRLFWIIVVIAGFTGAGMMIYQSFQSWEDSPVKTAEETRPVAEITFPKVTVCPPKNTFTNLNYDLIMTENMTLDNDTRNELIDFAEELLYEQLYDKIMTNISKFKDNDRYHNWYYGYTEMRFPEYNFYHRDSYVVNTAAISGSISTKDFGEEFDADKVDTNMDYKVYVYPPNSVRKNPNVTLNIEIENLSLEDLTHGQHDELSVDYKIADFTHALLNYTPPTGGRYRSSYCIDLNRYVTIPDVRKQKLNLMPGFKLIWNYSGIKVKPEVKYANTHTTKAFVRFRFHA